MDDATLGNSNNSVSSYMTSKSTSNQRGVTVLENKKRTIDRGMGHENNMGFNTKLRESSEEDESMCVEENDKPNPNLIQKT